MRLHEIIGFLEGQAHPSLQENYDNSGLITGDPEMEVTGAVLCLDCTEAVVQEAVDKGFNLVIAHHPIVFSGMKRLTGRTYVERTVILAIRKGVAIYAIHTNLDNVRHGVNGRIASVLGLDQVRILDPRPSTLLKLGVYVPVAHAETVRNALFAAGIGHIGNYDECSFSVEGKGSFRPLAGSAPEIGQHGERSVVPEIRIELVLPAWKQADAWKALRASHPYEEIAYDLVKLENTVSDLGSGVVGELPEPVPTEVFLRTVKERFRAGVVRHTAIVRPTVRRIAVCGGSGSFLLAAAIRSGADVFITSDMKYHQFFDADGRITVADIGHYEGEQFTIDLLSDWFAEKFPTFATHKTGVVTNPVHYL